MKFYKTTNAYSKGARVFPSSYKKFASSQTFQIQ